jgi:hypothetical protein
MTSEKMEKEHSMSAPEKDQAARARRLLPHQHTGLREQGWSPQATRDSVKGSSSIPRRNKRTMGQYFGGGERVKPPFNGGTPIQSILQQQLMTMKESTTGTDDTVGKQHNLEQSNKEG